MSSVARNYQNQLLDDACQNKKLVSIFLHNGVKIDGNVISHDIYTVLIQSKGEHTLVYKHSITTIFPAFLQRPPMPTGNEVKKN